jgi:hypothetical protein
MAPTPDEKRNEQRDLLLKIERCRRLATQTREAPIAVRHLELATEYLKQLRETKAH